MKKVLLFVALMPCLALGQKLTKSKVNGNWSSAATWTNGIPGSKDTAVINNNVTVAASATVATILINTSGNLTNTSTLNISCKMTNNGTYTDISGAVNLTGGTSAIKVGGTKNISFYNLTVNNGTGVNATDTIIVKNYLSLTSGILTVSSGYLILQNDATYNGRVVSVAGSGDISGTFRAEIWDNRCSSASIASDYSTYSPAMSTNLNSMGLLLASNAYTYDETQPGNLSVGYVAVSTNTTTINRGQGFFYDYTNYIGGPNFARKIPVIGAMSFTSPFSFNVSYTASTGGPTSDGWNLLGNPFPGTIDWNSSSWTINKVDNAVYTWNTCSNLYAAYVAGVGTNGGSRYINEFQGFWVHAHKKNPVLKASSKVLTSNSSALLRTTTTTDTIPMAVHIFLGSDEMAIRLDSGASDAFDTLYDALELFTDSTRLYSFVIGDTTDSYAINAVKDTDYKVVPFSVYGSGTLTIAGVSSMEYAVYLKDRYTGITYPAYDGFQYTYTQNTANNKIFDNKRFELIFKDTSSIASVTNQTNLNKKAFFFPNPSKGEITVQCPEIGAKLFIYDALGREVLYKGLNVNKTSLHLNLPDGVYFLRILSEKSLLLEDKLVISKS